VRKSGRHTNIPGVKGDDRIARCLARLLPHVDGEALALTGGVAMAHHLPKSRDDVADVDFVARAIEAVAPSVARDFLISHRHDTMVQLVEPKTRLRVDLFVDRIGAVARAQRGLVAGALLPVVTAADLLAHKLELLAHPVDEKHWRDACALAARCGAPPPPRPAAFAPDVYSRDLALVCARCQRSLAPEFPLAPKKAVFDVLGYV
jgi:hypothetical protein